jgi:adenosylcobinamide-phosphate synthase
MIRARAIAAACLLDWIAGDPEWFPHPVRWMGRYTQLAESLLHRTGQSARSELMTGATLTAGLVGASYLGTAKAIEMAYRIGTVTGWATEVLLGWACLASRNLIDESLAVIRALEQEDLARARQRLSRIVGRDTQSLSETEIHRAVIETLAESACDGIVAPLVYMAIGGVPMAMAYKSVNTLDSMIGHADQRYLYFGKVAARLDDVANYLPSRVTALALATAAGMGRGTSAASALRIWQRDGGKHKSPNAGQPESAMAGALQVRLGGENTYAGECIAAPLLGAEFEPPMRHHAKQALRLVAAVSLFSAVAAIAIKQFKCSISNKQFRLRTTAMDVPRP